MLTLKDYVNWGLTHCDKIASAEGVPIVLEKCVKNKRMKQLEVYGNSVQDGTPTPENPVEVESVGEIAGIRLDKSLYSDLSLYSIDGYYTAYKVMYIEGFKPNTSYYVNVNRLNGSAVNTVKTVMVVSGGTFSVINGAYTTLSHTNGSADYNYSPHITDSEGRLTIGIAKSATQEQLESILNNVNVFFAETKEEADNGGKYKVPVIVRGKNLVDLSEFVSKGKMKLNDASTGEYEFINTSGMPNLYVDFTYVDYYVVKCEVMAVKEQNIMLTGRNASGSAISRTGFTIAGVVGEWKSVTQVIAKSDIPNIAYFIFGGGGGLATGTKIRGFQIERGSVATECEPYVEPITTNVYLNEPLRKIGDYADVLDFKMKKVVRNIDEWVFNSTKFPTSKWIIANTADGLHMFRWYGMKLPESQIFYCGLCNQYPVVLSSKRADKTLSGYSNLDFIDINYSSTSEWTAHLDELYNNGTPMKLVYALATPYEEPIECELPTLTAKTSIVEIDTALLPSNIKGKYIKR